MPTATFSDIQSGSPNVASFADIQAPGGTASFDDIQPSHDPNDRFFSGAPGEIRAAQPPSVWNRITDLFSSRKPAEPGLGTTPLTEAIGSAVPQSALPALAAVKRYAVDPFERVTQAGADTGREIGREAVTGATILSHAGDYLNASMPSPYGPKASAVNPGKPQRKNIRWRWASLAELVRWSALPPPILVTGPSSLHRQRGPFCSV